ncbi:hypothetical protein V8E54_000991 [Elaphomyces granulatus]|jgi:hypothetical protein
MAHAINGVQSLNSTYLYQQMSTLVQNAFVEMRAQCQEAIWNGRKLPSKRFPRAMTALASPDKKIIFLASSMKKLEGDLAAVDYFYSDAQMAVLLDRGRPNNNCQTHRTGGCGEVVALSVSLDYIDPNKAKGGSILTWGISPKSNPPGHQSRTRLPRHLSPCSEITHDSWGCQEVVDAAGIIAIGLPLQGQNLPAEDPVIFSQGFGGC